MNADVERAERDHTVPNRLLEWIRRAERPAILSHIRLDGDAIGSQLGLLHILKALGKHPHAVSDSMVPQVYRFLPGVEELGSSPDELRHDYDLGILLDTPTWKRAERIRERLPRSLPMVSIDHHLPIEPLADVEWLDTSRSSVGEMIYVMAEEAHWPIPREAATCLYVAILTDTGRFTFPNTTADSLRIAGRLIELGADHIRAAEQIYQETSFSIMSLRAEALQGLTLFADGRAALMRLTHEMMQRHGVDPIDTQEMADYPRAIAGVLVGVLLREMKDEGKVKVSLRSRNGVDVQPLARKFGGGGHREAAGCEVPGSMERVEELVVGEVVALLEAAEKRRR